MYVTVTVICAECGKIENRDIDDTFQLTPSKCHHCEANEEQGFDNADDPFSSRGQIRPLDFNE